MTQLSGSRVSALAFVDGIRVDMRRAFRRSTVAALVVHAVGVALLMQSTAPPRKPSSGPAAPWRSSSSCAVTPV